MKDSEGNGVMRECQVVAKALELGATSAGVADAASLRRSPSFEAHRDDQHRDHLHSHGGSHGAQSLLVFTLSHPRHDPELDWWDNHPGGTPGNRRSREIAASLTTWCREHAGINASMLPYELNTGGVFLKDAAVLAGLGVIGRNNLLITPGCGAAVRLRAITLDGSLPATGPVDYAPCSGCPAPCLSACPQGAFESGSYEKTRCQVQMRKDEANRKTLRRAKYEPVPREVIRYCRACESACPVAR